MKSTETVLADFIRDYKLELPGEAVCFDAEIEFKTATVLKNLVCPVHIVTMESKKQSIIYLLNDELAEFGLPDTFPFDPEAFRYQPEKGLTVTDYDLLRGKFTLSIVPLTRCTDPVPMQ